VPARRTAACGRADAAAPGERGGEFRKVVGFIGERIVEAGGDRAMTSEPADYGGPDGPPHSPAIR